MQCGDVISFFGNYAVSEGNFEVFVRQEMSFVAVHSGAGCFPTSCRRGNLDVCHQAAIEGIRMLKVGETAVEASCAATVVLEDSPFTNAGFGATLTSAESVELDATVMDGSTLDYGSVGAIPSVKNPIKVAKAVMNLRRSDGFPEGLVPPSLLVGSEAAKFARLHGIPTVSSASLVTANSLKSHRNSLARLVPSDTVGVICLSRDKSTAATSSSGGSILKVPGRIGAAGVFGAASWAEVQRNDDHRVLKSIAVSVSGCGECLIRTNFARNFAETIMREGSPLLSMAAEKHLREFVRSPLLQSFEKRNRLAGFVCLYYDGADDQAELVWAHNSWQFSMAHMGSGDLKPKSFISTGHSDGDINVGGVKIKLRCD